jgi:transposase-like protein
MNCQNCNNTTFYNLQDAYIKCKKCAKKYSLKKLLTEQKIKKAFIQNKTALESSKELGLNYRTVKDRYDEYRYKITMYLEEEYNNSIKDNSEYEEYYYFNQRQKNKKKKSLFEAINIMGFYSNERVFTLFMPKLLQRTNDIKDNSFENYLKWHKLYSKQAHKTKLSLFWKYLEENLKKYKGIKEAHFFYYLKECEFRFNYSKEEQIEILKDLYVR